MEEWRRSFGRVRMTFAQMSSGPYRRICFPYVEDTSPISHLPSPHSKNILKTRPNKYII